MESSVKVEELNAARDLGCAGAGGASFEGAGAGTRAGADNGSEGSRVPLVELAPARALRRSRSIIFLSSSSSSSSPNLSCPVKSVLMSSARHVAL